MKNCTTILIALLFFTPSLLAQTRPVLFPQPAQVNYTAGANALSLQRLTIYLPANAPKNISFALNELKPTSSTPTLLLSLLILLLLLLLFHELSSSLVSPPN